MTPLAARRPHRSAALTAVLTLGLAVTACNGEDNGANAGSNPSPVPDVDAPSPEGMLTTDYPATVMDTGENPELCLGAIAESYPPQCGGPQLIGWDWDDQDPETYEEAEDTRWGEYVLIGDYDPHEGTFEVERFTPAEEWDGDINEHQVDFTSPCEEFHDEAELEDPDLVSEEQMHEALAVAEQADGYAGSWIDQSLNPNAEEDINDPDLDEEERLELEASLNDPEYVILNVQVTQDPDTAYDAIREEWGGMLCVTEVERGHEELRDIQQALMSLSVVQSAYEQPVENSVIVDVDYDDGTLQSQFDETYGEGTVQVVPRLQPADQK